MPFLRKRSNVAPDLLDTDAAGSLATRQIVGDDSIGSRKSKGSTKKGKGAAGSTKPNGTSHTGPAPPITPPHDGSFPEHNGDGIVPHQTQPRLSLDRPESPPIQDDTLRISRFSALRFRNASDPQLSARAKKHALSEGLPPPLPKPPGILTTAPTLDFKTAPRQGSRVFTRFRRSGDNVNREALESSDRDVATQELKPPTLMEPTGAPKASLEVDLTPRPNSSHLPVTRRHASSSNLEIPRPRFSESSRSDGSSGSNGSQQPRLSDTGRSNTRSGSFLKMSGLRRRPPEPMFPIAHLRNQSTGEGRASNSSFTPSNPPRDSTSLSWAAPRSSLASSTASTRPIPSPSRPSALALFTKGNSSSTAALFRRPSSRNSAHSSLTKPPALLRGRSSTMSSLGQSSLDDRLAAPPDSRTSISTGRKSFGDLLGLGKTRTNSDVAGSKHAGTPATPGSSVSKSNSLHIQREPVTLPPRNEDENPFKYLTRIEDIVRKSAIAAALARKTDQFSLAALRSYMRKFAFFGDPMDMAIRKLLMDAELPRETQHIDRFLEAFSNRYDECNPGIYSTPEQAYFIAFSLLILHTDVFNKNNKHKMQRTDYVKNTSEEGIYEDILGVFYDNIAYTPFIHVEDDADIQASRTDTNKSRKKGLFPLGDNPEAMVKRAAREPIDPYLLIFEQKLDILRPSLKDVMHLEDHYTTLGTSRTLDIRELHAAFYRTGVIQILSARSRPDAFMTHAANPEEAQPGLVNVKVTKVGILLRKDAKKKKTRRPWQEWGAVLTGSQLYLFQNAAWVKDLMHQYEAHIKQGQEGIPLIFSPPLANFKPDALFPVAGAVALLDTAYKKHKHAFTYVRPGGIEEIMIAPSEDEMNDWLSKLNFAAAFQTTGARMRGNVTGVPDGQGGRAMRRLNSDTLETAAGGEVEIVKTVIDHGMAREMAAARREDNFNKVTEANEKLRPLEKKLEVQLRNGRHLQILAPIQPKTRDQMLLSAARIAAQLKWTRIEIWKLQCHRDILLLDLEDERVALGLPVIPTLELAQPSPLIRGTSKLTLSSTVPSLRSTSGSSQLPFVGAATDVVSPISDAPQTSPTIAFPKFSLSQHSPHEATAAEQSNGTNRKASLSSVASEAKSLPTPPRKLGSSGSATAPSFNSSIPRLDDSLEEIVLQQTGLLPAPTSKPLPDPSDSALSPVSLDAPRSPDRTPRSQSKERQDRHRLRRSLQRTLRDGAGHIPHARGRRGRESVSSALTDENAQETETLPRSSGSFVVHGKKASVINFGSELQNLTTEEHRARRNVISGEYSVLSSSDILSEAGGDDTMNEDGVAEAADDIEPSRAGSQPRQGQRRGSATSASTITALSFKELHRKYSTAQAAARHASGSLAVPSADEDSDAAISFSDGRCSPMPRIESEEDLLDDQQKPHKQADEATDKEEEVDEIEDFRRDPSRRTLFFTPEPPRPASSSTAGSSDDNDDERDNDEGNDHDDNSEAGQQSYREKMAAIVAGKQPMAAESPRPVESAA